MYSVSYLKKQRRSYEDKREEAERSIRKNEKEYDSLLEFKRIVERSQSSFHAAHAARKSALEDVAAVKANCRCARKYYNGMKLVYDGVGAKIISGVYNILLVNIKNKLTRYRDQVGQLEDRVRDYEEKINELDEQIAEAEALAAEDDAAL